MRKKPYHYYLIHLQFLGFRYHGWMKQPEVKTVQGMVDRTLAFIFGHEDFKTLGASRTDAGVSANEAALELFVREPLEPEELLAQLNLNLPNDIRAMGIEAVDRHFNIIQHPKVKEYTYLFSYGEKNHPFCAPFMVYMREPLDIPLMKKGAKLFEGTHNFKRYCIKPGENTVFEREILHSVIRENDLHTASFFPKESFVYYVHGKGFLRHQVRLMMGALFALGKGNLSLAEIEGSLKGKEDGPIAFMAPQTGLTLNKMSFEDGAES
ncbi:tRNA pseudouridine synthase A [Nafulsella turpanensis]|uniref:tRNA pseudouridine synthase A n=1 Tax=Nafulsella turpanensis TaxID=1265690 RepID=UPI0003628026|nr:hypothetical protein [Nafulsella turpanensis]